jgi:hypothetical protein
MILSLFLTQMENINFASLYQLALTVKKKQTKYMFICYYGAGSAAAAKFDKPTKVALILLHVHHQ